MQNYWEKLVEEYNKQNPGALPEDAATRMPPEIGQELASRIPQSDPSNFDVHVSDNTVTMNGRPESLPSSAGMPDMPAKKWELEEDVPEAAPQPVKSEPDVTVEKSAPVASKIEDVFPKSDNDKAVREAGMADLEKQRKRNIITELAAGAGDAISAGASAFGGNAPGGSQARLVERHGKDMEQGKKDIEQKLRNDPNSDISKQYQELVARFMQKDPKDPALLGLTANQIAEKIPQVEKLASMRQQDELTRLKLEENRLLKTQMAQQKADKTADELWTPMGQAKTKNDAKIVKDIYMGYEGSKSNLDELIDIRKAKGAEVLDRKSVNRAKTIAADLTVQYKDLAKLGVLSKDDYRLLERLIPSDPLQFDIMASTPASLQEARDLLDRRIDAYAKGYGLQSPIQKANGTSSDNKTSSSRKTKSGISYTAE